MPDTKISLADGEALHFAHPDTFQLPTYWERIAVQPGSWAKLIFEPIEPGDCAERMWVKVTSNNNGEYVGTLDNQPLMLGLEWGDEVSFSAKHIISIDVPEDGGV